MAYSTFHNHTTFCDGAHSAEEMVRAAIAAGMPTIGFSGHSYAAFDSGYCMSPETSAAYRAEIARLKREYAGQIRILCGVEQDYYSDAPTDGYDYVIGSVHYVLKNGQYLPVDHSREALMAGVNAQYNGDVLAFCEDYYRQAADVVRKLHCTFVGHFDLVTKFNEGNALFDPHDPRYVKASQEALDALCDAGALFEINTRAQVCGYRTAPYPAEELLERIRDRGCSVILSADCHNKEQLQCFLPEADALAARLGLHVVREL